MGLFDSWRKRALPIRNSQVSDALVRDASAYVVRLTDPKLALANRSEARLLGPVRNALEFIARSIGTLPPLCELDLDNWMANPQLASFFVSGDEITEAFSRAEEVQRYFSREALAETVCAVLTTRMIEREAFGVALAGGQLLSDVRQLRISFSDPKVPITASDEKQLRLAIGRRMFEELAMLGMEQIATRREERRELGEARSLLLARERMLQHQGAGFGEPPATVIKEVEARLRENSRALAKLGDGADALERDLDDICTVLDNAGQRIGIERRALRLTTTNQLVEGDPGEPVRAFEQSFAVIRRGEQTRERAFLMVRFPRSALRKTRLDLDAATRLL